MDADVRGLGKRALGAILVLWIVVTAVFAAVHLAPEDARARIDDPRAPESQRALLRQIYGLDDPLPQRYVRWLQAAARGDWGISITHQQPVSQVLTAALPPTLTLGSHELALGTMAGLAAGLLAASEPNSLTERPQRWAAVLV